MSETVYKILVILVIIGAIIGITVYLYNYNEWKKDSIAQYNDGVCLKCGGSL